MFVDASPEVIKQMKNAARRGCRKIAKEIVQDAIEHAPNKRGYIRQSMKFGAAISTHTGQAKGSVGFLNKKKLKIKGIKFVINPAWLEFGTKPHMVDSGGKRRDGKKLKILANKSSQKIFGGSISHPGAKPVPLLRTAGARVGANAKTIAESEIRVLNESLETLKGMRDDGNDEIE